MVSGFFAGGLADSLQEQQQNKIKQQALGLQQQMMQNEQERFKQNLVMKTYQDAFAHITEVADAASLTDPENGRKKVMLGFSKTIDSLKDMFRRANMPTDAIDAAQIAAMSAPPKGKELAAEAAAKETPAQREERLGTAAWRKSLAGTPPTQDITPPATQPNGPLADRFAGVQDAIKSGVFDPQGANATKFAQSPGAVAPTVPPGFQLPPGYTMEAIDRAAERYRQTGTFPAGLTRGADRQTRAAIQNLAAFKDMKEGISAEDRPRLQQEFKSQQVAIQRFTSGPQGNIARSLGVAVDHMDTLKQLALAAKNKNNTLFNQIAQNWAALTGKAVPTNIDMAKTIVGPEIIKALGVQGAGTAEERQEAGNLGQKILRAASPDQIIGAIDDVGQPLLAGQLRGLERQYMASTKAKTPDRFYEIVGPRGTEFLKKKKESQPSGGQPIYKFNKDTGELESLK